MTDNCNFCRLGRWRRLAKTARHARAISIKLLAFGAIVSASTGSAIAQDGVNTLPLCTSQTRAPLYTRATSLPPVGAEREIEIGGVVIATGNEVVASSGIEVAQPVSIPGKHAGGDYVIGIPAGMVPAVEDRLARIGFAADNISFAYLREKKERRGLGKPDITLFPNPRDTSQLAVRVSFGMLVREFEAPPFQFRHQLCRTPIARGLRREIIYSGGAKGVLNFQYREYMDNLARPAFSQDLTYDLANGNEIGFKGARIQIVRMSNVGLTIKVIREFE